MYSPPVSDGSVAAINKGCAPASADCEITRVSWCIAMPDRGLPLMPTPVFVRFVDEIPGCAPTLVTAKPAALARRSNSRANDRLASLDSLYDLQREYRRGEPCDVTLRRSMLWARVCASELIVTMRASLRLSTGHHVAVHAKCPRWLVPICSSNPSAVVRLGGAMMPALFTKMSIRS